MIDLGFGFLGIVAIVAVVAALWTFRSKELSTRQWRSMPRWLGRSLSCDSRLLHNQIFTSPCMKIRGHPAPHAKEDMQW